VTPSASATASLLEDGGAAASDSAEFFRCPEFLGAEGVTHTVAISSQHGELRLPVIVRPIGSGGRRDAISPYGYPGADSVPEQPLDPADVDWSGTGLVSLFVRDRIGSDPCLEGGTLRSQVHIADGEQGIRKRLREQIRRNARRGWSVDATPGPQVDAGALAAFERAYAETMARTGAAERYLYPSEYFRSLLGSDRSRLVLATLGEDAPSEATPAAGAIAAASDGHLHYYLGGTSDAALDDSPMKNVFAAMIGLGVELGLPLNLGGGVTPGDSLDSFKRGFATAEAAFRTHEVVCDPVAYEELSGEAGADPGGYFPAYRAP
jgi:GNAT acetyltransferase-like protein